jgi:hypothetical protein
LVPQGDSVLPAGGKEARYHKAADSAEFITQRLGVLQIRCIKPLREPAVHWGQQVIGVLALLLGLPQAGQAGGGAEFPGFGLLAAGNVDDRESVCLLSRDLLTHGAEDRQVPVKDARALFNAVGSKDKTFKLFTANEGGSQHCQRDNLSLGVTYICDWLQEKLAS